MKPLSVVAFARSLYATHPELMGPVRWQGFLRMAERSGIAVRVVPLSRPARLIRYGQALCIQIQRELNHHLRTLYGMHELCHAWRDELGMECIYADEETVMTDPKEDFADLFAWYVTSEARIFHEPLEAQLKSDLSPVRVDGDGRFAMPVVGESFCEGAFLEICGPRRPEGYDVVVAAALVPENDNRADPKAVRVEVSGKKVGYLSRSMARRYRMRFARRTVYCKARITGGWNRGGTDTGNFGVRLDLTGGAG
ncbi:MAG: HIRAN domain-containing protein [Gemmatimonadaceae bacterium]